MLKKSVYTVNVYEHMSTLEPCTITYVGDRYLVHPVQVCVPMNYRVVTGTR